MMKIFKILKLTFNMSFSFKPYFDKLITKKKLKYS